MNEQQRAADEAERSLQRAVKKVVSAREACFRIANGDEHDPAVRAAEAEAARTAMRDAEHEIRRARSHLRKLAPPPETA